MEVGILLELLGRALDLRRIVHLNRKRGGQRVLAVERAHGGVGVTRHLARVLGQRVVLILIGHGLDVAPRLELGLKGLDVCLIGVIANKGINDNLILDGADHGVQHRGAHDEQADDKQRKEDRDDGAERGSPVTEEVADCLFEGVAHVSWCHSCRNLPSPGRE